MIFVCARRPCSEQRGTFWSCHAHALGDGLERFRPDRSGGGGITWPSFFGSESLGLFGTWQLSN